MKSPPHLSLSVEANGFLYLSGQLAFGEDGKTSRQDGLRTD